MTQEILQFIAVITLLFGTWKVTEIAREMGSIKTLLEVYRDKLKEHDERISKLERGDQTPGRPDSQRPSGFGGRLTTAQG